MFIIPGPCNISFYDKDLKTTKAGVSIRTTNHDTLVQHDAGGSADQAMIRGGKSLTVSMMIQDPNFNLARMIINGIFGLYGLTVNDDGGVPVLPSMPAGVESAPIGVLASAIGQTLLIQERIEARAAIADAGDYQWIASKAVMLDPETLGLTSTSELLIPCAFMLIPVTGRCFQTVPTYIQA
jgi:hypothetical protein